mmetsp:Transcript_1404/g.2164  ORF Transcript_1404/g.2164 Transcript_1404/m.2164 type:complete len:167 (-) Transcript_1404:86-586(-)
MSAKDLPGVSLPFGFFDPLGFSAKATPEVINKYRESELKHGRVAMLAVLGWATTEITHFPMFANSGSNPLKAMVAVPFYGWLQILFFCGFAEFVSQKIKEKPGYVPGDYLGAASLMDESDQSWINYQTKELNNGRLAMLAIIGFIGQTAIFGQNILEQSTGKPTLF